MSSPQKKSIREARLEKIEQLLEEHEKSTFVVVVPDKQPAFCFLHVATCGFMFLIIVSFFSFLLLLHFVCLKK
jgi:hypothetical protein